MMNSPSFLQTKQIIPPSYQVIDNIGQFNPLGQKNYVIVPASLAHEIVANLPVQDINKVGLIIYGVSPPAPAHPAI